MSALDRQDKKWKGLRCCKYKKRPFFNKVVENSMKMS